MIVRGVIRYFDPATYLAAVELGGSIATVVEAMPVATHIRKEHVVVGRKCGVVLFDPNNPSDACVAFVYGAVNPGHITIDQGYEFRPGGDANSAFGEDGAGNAYLKDAVVGTKTATQFASMSAQAGATSTITLTTTEQDVPGASLSLGVGTWLVVGVFDFSNTGGPDGISIGRLNVGGTNQGKEALHSDPRYTISQWWRITLASIQTVKLRGVRSGSSGTRQINAGHTAITAIRTAD